jgi:hypothetical protein
MNADQNRVTYLKWLAVAHPDVYRKAMAGANNLDEELGELGWINLVIQGVAIAAGAVAQKKQIDKTVALQKKALLQQDAQASKDRDAAAQLHLLDVNTERAKAGLPPVDITGKVIAGASLPTPRALAPYDANPPPSLIPGVHNYVTYGAGALALVLLLKSFKVI